MLNLRLNPQPKADIQKNNGDYLMAGLKKCKDCGHDVSTSAEACPNCGARLKRRWYEIGPFTSKLVIGTTLLVAFLILLGST